MIALFLGLASISLSFRTSRPPVNNPALAFTPGGGRRHQLRRDDVGERHGYGAPLGLDHALSGVDRGYVAQGIRRHSVVEAVSNDDALAGGESHHELGA